MEAYPERLMDDPHLFVDFVEFLARMSPFVWQQ
jgi:hypothetical protein